MKENPRQIPFTMNGKTIEAWNSPTGIERAEAILRGEQGVSILDFEELLTPKILEQLIEEACLVFDDPEASPEDKQKAWRDYSQASSFLTNLNKKI